MLTAIAFKLPAQSLEDEAPSGPESQPEVAPPTRRARPVELGALLSHYEGEAIVADGRRQAEALVAEARRRATQAHAEAEFVGRNAAEASLAEAWQRLHAVSSDTSPFEDRLRAATRQVAARLVVASLERDPALMVDRARVALKSVVRARRVALYVNADDVEPLKERLGALGLDNATVQLHAIQSCPRWGLRAETDVGTVDAYLEPQLDQLVTHLRPWPYR